MPWTEPTLGEWNAGNRVFEDMLKEEVLGNLQYLKDAVNQVGGVGTIVLSGRAAPPFGFALCDGAPVNRTTFSDLFAAIGVAFGPGDGSTTFNLPDLRQRFPIGKAASGTASVLGSTGGLIGHVHTVTDTDSQGSHAHTQGATGSAGTHAHNNPSTAAAGSHNHGGVTAGATKGVVGGHVFWGTGVPLANQDEHHHGITTQANHAHTLGDTGDSSTHTHTNPNVVSGGAHTHNVPGGTGAGDPPWLAVNYMIRTLPV